MPSTTDFSTHNAKALANQLVKRDQRVVLQWVPGYVGIVGNVRADRLAADTHHSSQVVVYSAPNARGPQRELLSPLREHFQATLNKRKDSEGTKRLL